jgi:hypothetical protein
LGGSEGDNMSSLRKVGLCIGIFLLVAVTGLLILGKSLEVMWRPFSSTYGSPIETINVYWTLKNRLDDYFQSATSGDIDKALANWKLPADEIPSNKLALLSERRDNVTSFLISKNVSPDYSILEIILWSPQCCESRTPGVTGSYTTAIGARVTLQLIDKSGNPLKIYIADIFAAPSHMGYWGESKYWYIRDLYTIDDEPIYWRYKYVPNIEPLP